MGLDHSKIGLKTFEIWESVKHRPQTQIHTNTTIYYKTGSSIAILSTKRSSNSCQHPCFSFMGVKSEK